MLAINQSSPLTSASLPRKMQICPADLADRAGLLFLAGGSDSRKRGYQRVPNNSQSSLIHHGGRQFQQFPKVQGQSGHPHFLVIGQLHFLVITPARPPPPAPSPASAACASPSLRPQWRQPSAGAGAA